MPRAGLPSSSILLQRYRSPGFLRSAIIWPSRDTPGKGGSRLGRRGGNSAFKCLKGAPHSAGEHVEVWAKITVGDDREVELSGVGEGADADGEVRGEGHDRKDLEKGSAGEVQRDRGAGHVGHVCVHEPLTGHEPQEGTLQEHGPEHAPCGGPGLLLPFRRLCGDLLEPPDVVAFPDRQRHQHPGVEVAPGLSRLFLVERDRDEGAEYDTLDGLAAASEQLRVTGATAVIKTSFTVPP
jgi:hypothetical protein